MIEQDCFDPDFGRTSPLQLCIEKGHLSLAQMLLERGANPNIGTAESASALLSALEHEYFDLAELMVAKGAEVDVRNDKGWTPLIWAAIKGRKQAVEFLIKHNADIHACNNDGWNAVTGAFFKKRTDIVELLKQKGAVFGARFAEAALMSAYQDGNLRLVNELLDSGVSASISDETGESLLAKAMGRGDRDIVIRLLELGADPNARCNNESMPLLVLAATDGDLELVEKFIVAGAGVNLSSSKGRTALWRAACNNHIEVVNLLLKHGANPNASFDNQPILFYAVSHAFTMVVIALVKAGANIESMSGSKRCIAVAERGYQDAKAGSSIEAAFKEIRELVKPRGMNSDR
ncbi:ankyrin repeat domain-containing protein [Endozoicomonas acroporae]|uniref:ankyrin repeat domain-containing protein n=1 Tax=Endozoicomonas acroporae TaxID=1701104 RepID=UPI003D7B8C78